MPGFNAKLIVIFLSFGFALLLLRFHLQIADGTGIVVATLAGGGGWLARDLYNDARSRRTICQAYAAAIETLFIGFADSLSDAELSRYLKIAEDVQRATPTGVQQQPTPDIEYEDPLAGLPKLERHLHLLRPRTVRFLSQWQDRSQSLQRFYCQIGNAEFCKIPAERLEEYLNWGKKYRDDYRDIGFTALLAIMAEDHGVEANVSVFRRAGASRINT